MTTDRSFIDAVAEPLRELGARYGRKAMLSFAADDEATPYGVCFDAPYGDIAVGRGASPQAALEAAEVALERKLTDVSEVAARRLKVERIAHRTGLVHIIDKLIDAGVDPLDLRAKLEAANG